ncbi:hypothetical protein [Pseudocolwellia agarivorans]|uniref:hypothetical protein n=1 Tax=Pseudocolwellia agarivorans TaxID=1911682 RepID=UPI003F884B53
MNIEMMGFGEQFTQKEACKLLNSHVIKKENESNENLAIEDIGFIAGVITLNDEIEVMVKFPDELLQLSKLTFNKKISLLEMT